MSDSDGDDDGDDSNSEDEVVPPLLADVDSEQALMAGGPPTAAFIIDSGASQHMTPLKEQLADYKAFVPPLPLRVK